MKKLFLIFLTILLVTGCSFHASVKPSGFMFNFTLEDTE